MRLLAVVPGPAGHGVVRHGLTVAGLVAEAGIEVTVARTVEPAKGSHDLTHVQFTDALFGSEIGAAAERFVQWARTAPRPLVITLHDVPGRDGDAGRDLRRRTGYRRVIGCCDAVVVSAAHEAQGARLVDGLEPVVVPLPVEQLATPGPRPSWADRPSVGVLGFIYPGKGHERVLRALTGRGVRLVAMGAVSPGHEPLLEDLRRLADTCRVELLVTGPLSAAELHAAARAVTVPVAAYTTTGASASLGTWLACGRRPLVTTGPYARELETRWPSSLLLAPAGDDIALASALSRVLAEPVGTWLTAAPPQPDVAGAHLAVYRSCLA